MSHSIEDVTVEVSRMTKLEKDVDQYK